MNLKLQILLTEALKAVAADARMVSAFRHLMSIYNSRGQLTGEEFEIAGYALGEDKDV